MAHYDLIQPYLSTTTNIEGIVVVVIVWKLDLQLLLQSVPITTKVVSSNPTHGDVYSIQHYVIKFVSDLRRVCGFCRYSSFLHQLNWPPRC